MTKRVLEEELVLALRAARAAVDQLDEAACAALAINRTDGRCLDIIDRESPIAAGALAAQSGLTTAAVTAVVDRLERAGYARRRRDPGDRRRVLVEPTSLARRRAAAIWGPRRHDALDALDAYSDEELELLIAFHRRNRQADEARAASVRELRFPGRS